MKVGALKTCYVLQPFDINRQHLNVVHTFVVRNVLCCFQQSDKSSCLNSVHEHIQLRKHCSRRSELTRGQTRLQESSMSWRVSVARVGWRVQMNMDDTLDKMELNDALETNVETMRSTTSCCLSLQRHCTPQTTGISSVGAYLRRLGQLGKHKKEAHACFV